MHLGQDASKLFPIEQQVVRPAQVRCRSGLLRYCLPRGQAGHQRDERRLDRRDGRSQQHAHVNPVRFFGVPGAAHAPAPGGLLFRQHHRTVWLAGMAQLQRHIIGRADGEEMMDLFSKRRPFKPPAKLRRNQHVRGFLQVVARAAVSLHIHAERAQFAHPAPHGVLAHADVFSQLPAAEHNHGIRG